MSPRILTLAVLGALATACGGSGAVAVGPASGPVPTGAGAVASTSGGGSGSITVTQVGSGAGTASATMPVQVWLERDGGLWPVARRVKASVAVLGAAVSALLGGPTPAERADGVTSAVPAGTQLLGISLHGGVATIDVTSEFGSGSAADERMRLAQLVYTVTEHSGVRGVTLHLNGRPVSAFSDGLVLPDPITRQSMSFSELVPPIAVARPAAGATVRAPFTVSGVASVFEATLKYRLLGQDGKPVLSGETSSSCGTGCAGAFSFSIDEMVISHDQPGTLVISGDNPSGIPGHAPTVRVPLQLTAPYDVTRPADGATLTSPVVVSFRHPPVSDVLVRVFDGRFHLLASRSIDASCIGLCDSTLYTVKVPFAAAGLQPGYLVLSPLHHPSANPARIVEIPVTLNGG